MSLLNKNQTFEDATTTIVDNGDNTKALAFDVSGVTTGNTRTVTVPDKSGTMAMTDDILSAAPSFTHVSKTTTYTMAIGEWVHANTSGGAWTLTLPTAVGNAGKRVAIYLETAGSKLTIDGNSTETITTKSETAQTVGMWVTRDLLVLESDGTNWIYVHDGLNPHICEVARGSAQTIATATNTKLTIDTTVIDNTSNMADISTNYRVNILRTDSYICMAYMANTPIDDGERLDIWIYVNGTLTSVAFSESGKANASLYIKTMARLTLTAGDYLEIYTQHNTGSDLGTKTEVIRRPTLSVCEIR